MPCFDKKLEASRSDFYNDLYRTRDVDCVLTSGLANSVIKKNYSSSYFLGEVEVMISEKQTDFKSLHESPFDQM